jgi:hypothetical protein
VCVCGNMCTCVRVSTNCLVLRPDTRENPGGKNGVMTGPIWKKPKVEAYSLLQKIATYCKISHKCREIQFTLLFLLGDNYQSNQLDSAFLVIYPN